MLPGFLTRLSRNRYWRVRQDTGRDQVILGPETRWIRQTSHRINELWTLDDSEGSDRPKGGLAGHKWSSGQTRGQPACTSGHRLIRPKTASPNTSQPASFPSSSDRHFSLQVTAGHNLDDWSLVSAHLATSPPTAINRGAGPTEEGLDFLENARRLCHFCSWTYFFLYFVFSILYNERLY